MNDAKRKQPLTGSFLAPKRTKFDSTDTHGLVTLHGSITRLKYPSAYELYDGFAIVIIADRKVVGRFPILDPNLIYHLECRKQSSEYGVDYHVESFLDPPFEPVPVSCLTLQRMIQETLSIPPMTASKYIAPVRTLLADWNQNSTAINLSWLLEHLLPTPDWLAMLAFESIIFKYESIIRLQKVWSCNALSRLTIATLSEVVDTFSADVKSLFCSWTNEFGLPELTIDGYKKALVLFNLPGNPNIHRDPNAEETEAEKEQKRQWYALLAYSNAKAWKKNHQQWSIPESAMIDWPVQMQYLIKHKILAKTGAYLKTAQPDGTVLARPVIRVFIWRDLQIVRETMGGINRLFHSTPVLKVRKWNADDKEFFDSLNEEKKSVYELIFQQNLLIILGDAGTGKTKLGHMIYRSYPAGTVLPLAFFGKVAANMNLKYGRGMTIHKLVAEVTNELESAKQLVEKTRVVLIDEGSTLTVNLLHDVLRCLPNVRKIIIMGDEKQTPPPTSGAVFYALIEHFKNTPVVQRLTLIYRQSSPVLRENFKKIHLGLHNLSYSTDLNSEHPFVILPRESFPESWDLDSKMTAHRVTAYRRMLEPVVARYPNTEDFQVITQTNRVVADINHAMFLLGDVKQNKYGHGIFYVGEKVQIRQNDYGSNVGKRKLPEHVASHAVMKGEVKIIAEIYDAAPEGDPNAKQPRNSTADDKSSPWYVRMMRFSDGVQLNLKHYSIGNLRRGSASTIHSKIGSEGRIMVGIIHERFSETWTREDLYTLVTRASERVIMICAGGVGNLDDCDITKIIDNPMTHRECLFAHWLNPYRPPPLPLD